ncbi:TOBE domain-containing protein [Anoxynatronum buryatiense]|uniref:Molybdenum-pterin binding domain-containing protein n=1 Tax=Anoxynatronum buryatiense TaxID=489973 RepID=A0AA46AHH4_9CLOT|nr:TOBE domain-containing protein [Anoxynatronum buryatiense]SMP39926.1 molybdenum-pterin binding domain-containing protein [Anoxynatronum buryatiense]
MQITGRNQLKGKVVKVVHGVTSSEVQLEIAEGMIVTGLITKGSAESMNIQVGDELVAIIKATSVMFGKE